jgi:hypothetical protein
MLSHVDDDSGVGSSVTGRNEFLNSTGTRAIVVVMMVVAGRNGCRDGSTGGSQEGEES